VKQRVVLALGLLGVAVLAGCGGSSQPQARHTAANPVDGRELRQKYIECKNGYIIQNLFLKEDQKQNSG